MVPVEIECWRGGQHPQPVELEITRECPIRMGQRQQARAVRHVEEHRHRPRLIQVQGLAGPGGHEFAPHFGHHQVHLLVTVKITSSRLQHTPESSVGWQIRGRRAPYDDVRAFAQNMRAGEVRLAVEHKQPAFAPAQIHRQSLTFQRAADGKVSVSIAVQITQRRESASEREVLNR